MRSVLSIPKPLGLLQEAVNCNLSPSDIYGVPEAPSMTASLETRLNNRLGTPCLSPLSIQAAMALRNCLGPSRVPEQLFVLVPVQNNQQIEFFLLTLKEDISLS